MVQLKGPLFSQKAQKQLGKTLIYKTKKGKGFLTKYNKPGGRRLFTPSSTQTQMRIIYNEGVAAWNDLSDNEKEVYNENAKGQKYSGYNLFMKEWFTNHQFSEYFSYYGERSYGLYNYGKT